MGRGHLTVHLMVSTNAALLTKINTQEVTQKVMKPASSTMKTLQVALHQHKGTYFCSYLHER